MAALQGWELDWRAACKYDGIPAHNRWVQTGRECSLGIRSHEHLVACLHPQVYRHAHWLHEVTGPGKGFATCLRRRKR